MKTTISMTAAAIAALALTVACSSKSKVSDEPQPMDTSAAYQTVPETTVTPPAATVPDETAQVASLGASSSGRSR